MKRLLIFLFALLPIVGCSQIDKVIVYKIEAFSETDESAKISYTDPNTIKEIRHAFKKAQRVASISIPFLISFFAISSSEYCSNVLLNS
ncbi:hypothetical protein [Fredinandcohnia quinoae]|uniref:Lipoprotein n=1 Tax=Fredinandcohnia quinoae TaxID=2918902 RepID=A0AAW5DX01_9BACI|nr:hypothetical protein [Fredinandcohnia sp. SECRCQ15]MCH1624568.1 hypothetical protein [Fredinandcohnia sp. SECRCQ15]